MLTIFHTLIISIVCFILIFKTENYFFVLLKQLFTLDFATNDENFDYVTKFNLQKLWTDKKVFVISLDAMFWQIFLVFMLYRLYKYLPEKKFMQKTELDFLILVLNVSSVLIIAHYYFVTKYFICLFFWTFFKFNIYKLKFIFNLDVIYLFFFLTISLFSIGIIVVSIYGFYTTYSANKNLKKTYKNPVL